MVMGQSSQLFIYKVGDGAMYKNENSEVVALARATYLPQELMVSIRSKSGIETMAAGYKFRYGENTKFSLLDDSINFHEGAIFIQSKKIDGSLLIKSPESILKLSGKGTSLLEVNTNGGLKVVGVLGRLRLTCFKTKAEVDIMPGEIVFHMPGERSFGEKVNVNLTKLIPSSFLLSGFPNSESFTKSLSNVASAQEESIGKVFAASVGDSKEADSFEIVPTKVVDQTYSLERNASVVSAKESYQVPQSDPLSELLGRAPKRFPEQNFVPQIEETEAQPVEEKELLQDSENNSSNETVRPFPSRLLRKSP